MKRKPKWKELTQRKHSQKEVTPDGAEKEEQKLKEGTEHGAKLTSPRVLRVDRVFWAYCMSYGVMRCKFGVKARSTASSPKKKKRLPQQFTPRRFRRSAVWRCGGGLLLVCFGVLHASGRGSARVPGAAWERGTLAKKRGTAPALDLVH